MTSTQDISGSQRLGAAAAGSACGDDRGAGCRRQSIVRACRRPQARARSSIRRASRWPRSSVPSRARSFSPAAATEAKHRVFARAVGHDLRAGDRACFGAGSGAASGGSVIDICGACQWRCGDRGDCGTLCCAAAVSARAMLALQLANNETGVIQPVRDAAALRRRSWRSAALSTRCRRPGASRSISPSSASIR